MSNIELIVGSVVPRPKSPRSTYQVDLEFMHGDADGTTYRELTFKEKDVEKLKHYIVIYECINDYDGELNEDLALQCLVAGGLSEGAAQAVIDSFNDDTREGDITCDGSRRAAIVAFDITYWDHNGIQCEVSYKKD